MNTHHGAEPSDVFATAWDVFRRIVDNCPVGVFTADVSGRHVFVNRHWSVLTGVPRDKAVGRGWERAVHPEDVRTVTRQWHLLVTEGDELSIPVRLLQPDGTARPAILRAAAVVGENGHRRFAGTLTAVPDRGEADAELPDPNPGARPGQRLGFDLDLGDLELGDLELGDLELGSLDPSRWAAELLGPDAAEPAVDQPAGDRGSTQIEWPGETTANDRAVAGSEPTNDDRAADDGGPDDLPLDTVELLREELDRFDLATDDLWLLPGDDEEPAGPGWTVPPPRRPSAGEVDPPAVEPAEHPGRPFSERPLPERSFTETPFDDAGPGEIPFNDIPFGEIPFGKATFGEIPFGETHVEQASLGDQPGTEPLTGPTRARATGRAAPGPESAGDGNGNFSAGTGGLRPPAPGPGARPLRGGALPPGAEWRAAVTPHGDLGSAHHRTSRSGPAGGSHPLASGPTGSFGPRRGSSLSFGGPTAPGPASGSGHDSCDCAFAEIRRLSDACHERERWLTALMAELPSAVLVADADARVVAVNQTYCDLFDLAESPVDLVGTDCRAQLRPLPGLVEDPAGFASRLDTLLRRRRTMRRETVMFADGRVFERSHIPLAGPNGYHGHVWIYADVTDRRIVEAEIEGLISGL
ncbi:histidine kinase [Frankia sp. CcI49]|uniref:PAS domain-containing protein n=1 Tax=unclassified Frankia TaxID=2632575 RepID=UPI0006CA5C01|nr:MULTISPECIES: PAS domain-containing protein [unclassified Frankia]KPM51459.1 histidine kinase [Frankia sp. R43]ONH52971.1 histidine kinase [Frankia sp. CcI49]